MKQNTITENSIVESYIPVGEYRKYFKKTIGEDFDKRIAHFQNWLNSNAGRTVKKVIECYYKELDSNNGDILIENIVDDMGQLLKEDRFSYISKENKKFINEFTKQMKLFGYDFGGQIGGGFCWGNNMIIYSQTGAKNEKMIARIYIRDKGVIIWGGNENKFENGIVLRLFFNNIDKHRIYIENAQPYIKEPFTKESGYGVCDHCNKNCQKRKTYTIDGKQFEKCSGAVFEFHDPKIGYVTDYMNVLKEFYDKKSSKK